MSKTVTFLSARGGQILTNTGLVVAALIGLSGCALGLACFGWWAGLWLLILTATTFLSPAWGLGLLFLSISIDPVRPLFGQFYAAYSELQIAVFLSAWLAHDLQREERRAYDWRIVRWSVPFLVLVLVSGLVSSSLVRATANSLRFSEMFVVGFAAACVFDGSASGGPRFRRFLLVGALFHPLLGALQFPFVEWGRIYSTFTNPNQFAAYLNLLLPFAVVLFLTTRGNEKIVWCYTSLILLVASAATLSRAGFVAGLCGVLTVGVLCLRRASPKDARRPLRRLQLRRLLPHSLVVLLMAAALLSIPSTKTTLERSLHSLVGRSRGGVAVALQQARQPYFEVGWAIWKESFWLGVGPGNYTRALAAKRALVRSYRDRPPRYRIFVRSIGSHVHNLYLQTGVNFGILGLAAFLFFFLRLLPALLRNASGSPAACAGVGLVAAFLLHNLLDVTFPSLGIEMGILLGLSLSRNRL